MIEQVAQNIAENNLPQVGDYFTSPGKYYDQNDEMVVINVRSGEYHVTDGPGEMMVTVLGSCIATCIYDPVAKLSAMNHFLLPGDFNAPPSPKYGIFAMEYMINELLKRGGLKTRLQVKIFGGGKIIENSSIDVGERNIEFVKEYLVNESLNLVASDVGGAWPRRVHFFGDTGKVKMRKLERTSDHGKVIKEESAFSNELLHLKQNSSVELFGGK